MTVQQANFGRKPTPFERSYATTHGFDKLMEKLETREEWPPAPLNEDDVSD